MTNDLQALASLALLALEGTGILPIAHETDDGRDQWIEFRFSDGSWYGWEPQDGTDILVDIVRTMKDGNFR